MIPYFNIGENVVIEDNLFITYGKVSSISILKSKKRNISYLVGDKWFSEELIQSAVLKARKENNIYPFYN